MKVWVAVLFAQLAWTQPLVAAEPISADAGRLVVVLDSMHVEQHWPAGKHVNWETGVPDGKPERTEGRHTHCSAFVASVAKLLHVYILRPPDHGQILLANAQYDWLGAEGMAHGWSSLPDGEQAQLHANRGDLVVAAYRNHHDDKPGHIAIVRPSTKSRHALADEGPQIIQAGSVNYTSTSLEQGFAGHPAAWSGHQVRYYAHAIDWQHAEGAR
ncbi:MAG: hypothetical protein P4L92_01790 [Rudaea sp.]|nr:hypothetical protein [Rudaea sp.]